MDMFKASRKGDVNAVKKYIEKYINDGVDINEKHERGGFTPLMGASKGGHVEIVQLLLNAGADVNARDWYGWTAIHHAARDSHPEVVGILAEAGATIDVRTSGNQTPLHLAAFVGGDEENPHDINTRSRETAKILLDRGADVNAKSNANHTPLYDAVMSNLPETVQLLVDAGADTNVVSNWSQKTPLAKAQELGFQTIAQQLA